MTIQRMCEVGQVSRATFYRLNPDRKLVDEDLDLRDEIQRVALEFPCYGRPRVTAGLKRRGWDAGHRRVGRIMRNDNLLCLRKREVRGTRLTLSGSLLLVACASNSFRRKSSGYAFAISPALRGVIKSRLG